MECKVCSGNARKIFEGKLLGKYHVKYYFCSRCEHLQTQTPFWLFEAYKYPIAIEDTGILCRNMNNAVTITSIIVSFWGTQGKILDWAGGYGILVRLMRDIGLDFVWDDKYTKNLFARGFEYKPEDKITLVTAFEVLEHLENPMEELEKIFEIAPELLFTQTELPLPPPKQDLWWYYGRASGQHISFYTNKTLDFIASKFGKKHFAEGVFHLFTPHDISADSFRFACLNDTKIYAENLRRLNSKTGSDMNYLINHYLEK